MIAKGISIELISVHLIDELISKDRYPLTAV